MMGLLHASPHASDGGGMIGRDPRKIPAEDWGAAGRPFLLGLRAIRAKCIDCCSGNTAEVAKCVATGCPLWHLRMGRVPRGLRAHNDAVSGAPDDDGAGDTCEALEDAETHHCVDSVADGAS